jgi:hypothetical protein
LIRLAARGDEALARWAAENLEDDELSDDYVPWLTLEEQRGWGWFCGYRIRHDEASEWTIKATGDTPLAAARALLALMEDR